jgi:hypothetical protein
MDTIIAQKKGTSELTGEEERRPARQNSSAFRINLTLLAILMPS